MKKSYIIVFISLFVYLLLIIVLFGKDFNKNNTTEYLLIGTTEKLLFKNDKIRNFNDKKIINDTKFYVYDNNEYKGKYNIKYFNNKIYLFDDERNSIKLNGDLIAVSDKSKIKIKNYEINKIENIDDKYFQQILKKYRIKINSIQELQVNQKITLDFDNDNENETLYLISNAFLQGNNNDSSFSFVYYVDNDKIQIIIDEVVDSHKSLDLYVYSITGILDYNGDNKNEIFILRSDFTPYDDYQLIYKIEHGKYIPEKTY